MNENKETDRQTETEKYVYSIVDHFLQELREKRKRERMKELIKGKKKRERKEEETDERKNKERKK